LIFSKRQRNEKRGACKSREVGEEDLLRFLLKIESNRHRIKENYVYADVSFYWFTNFMLFRVNFYKCFIIHFTDKDVKSYPFRNQRSFFSFSTAKRFCEVRKTRVELIRRFDVLHL
jgi:hypothetical protein